MGKIGGVSWDHIFKKIKGALGRPRPRVNTANRYLESYLIPKKVWMDEYYDYIIRNEEDLMKHLHYINNNPVKRRLVESAEKYLWSSANSNFENDLEKNIGLRDEPDYLNILISYPNTSVLVRC